MRRSLPPGLRPGPRRRLALIAGATLAAVTPAHAIPAKLSPQPVLDPAALHVAVERGFDLGHAGNCAGALGVLDPLLSALPPGADRSAAQLVRLSCLAPAGRAEEIPAVQRELAAALPKNPYVRSMGVLVAASEGKFDVAAEQLADIAQNDPATLAMIPSNSWRGIAQQLTQSDEFSLRDKVVVALARADWQPADRPELRDSLAEGAIGALLADGQTSEAELLLARVTMPELLTEMAVERVYQPLWPTIEARMGPEQGRSADRFAMLRLDAFARAPDDPRALRDAVRAFILLGRYLEANETAASVRIAEGMDEDAVAIVRYDAQALAAAGRRDDALARLRPFTTLDPAKTPDAVAGLIEFAETLDEAGRAQDALGVARDALARGENALSPWGAAWLRRTELCTLATLGRGEEAREIGNLLKAKATDNEAAAVEGLLCARRTDEAAAIAVAALRTVEGADNIADQFQPEGAIWASSGSRLRALWMTLLARPDVKAAFEKRARVLPRSYWPARAPRAIPRPAEADAPGSPST